MFTFSGLRSSLLFYFRLKTKSSASPPSFPQYSRHFCRLSWCGEYKPGSAPKEHSLKEPLSLSSRDQKSYSCCTVRRLCSAGFMHGAEQTFGAAQTMHWHKCDHVKFELAHNYQYRPISFWIIGYRYRQRNSVSVHLYFKGIVHPKMKIMSLITHPHVVPNL